MFVLEFRKMIEVCKISYNRYVNISEHGYFNICIFCMSCNVRDASDYCDIVSIMEL